MSRFAFDVLDAEISRLRMENADLLGRLGALMDQVVRMQRVTLGMGEAPRAPLPPPELPPPEVANHIMGIGDSRIRAMVSSEMFRRRAREGGWDSVLADLHRNGAPENVGPDPGQD